MKHIGLPLSRGATQTLALVGLLASIAPAAAVQASKELQGPHPVPMDEFHPDAPAPNRAYGGEAVVHLGGSLRGLNAALENSAAATWIRHEVHDQLLMQDWETWKYRPSLARSYQEEDQVILLPGAVQKYAQARVIGEGEKSRAVFFGEIVEDVSGYLVTPSPSEKDERWGAQIRIPAEDVQAIERGTVATYTLPDDRRWHDGHLFDADDVLFSWQIYMNPHVSAARSRTQYQQILSAEVLSPTRVRFFFERQYFQSRGVPGEMCILPRHLFDLSDPDNRTYDPKTHAHFECSQGSGRRLHRSAKGGLHQ